MRPDHDPPTLSALHPRVALGGGQATGKSLPWHEAVHSLRPHPQGLGAAGTLTGPSSPLISTEEVPESEANSF